MTNEPPSGSEAGRNFGAVSLMLTGIGTVIGAGIFVITGQAAAAYAGPAIILSFAIAGLVCVFSGLCYAEMSAMMPVAGSAYAFTRAAFGGRLGWVVGWALIAEYLFAMAAIALGWSAYVQGLAGELGLHLPAAWASSPLAMNGQSLQLTGAIVNLPAATLVVAVTLSHFAPLGKSSGFNLAIVAIKLSAVALFIGFGLAHVDPANWQPFLPPAEPQPDGSSRYGWSGVVQAAGIVFFAYLGFDALGTAAGETRNPQRNLPVAILGTLAVSTLLYAAVALAMTGLAPFRSLGTDAPIATALTAAGPQLAWLKTYVGIAVSIGLWSAVWPCAFALSRLFRCFAEDGLLPPALARVSPVTGAPTIGLIVAGGLGTLIAGVLPIALLGELISTGTLIAFITVCAAVLQLRRAEPGRPRPFRVPAAALVAPLGMAACLFLLASMGWFALLRIALWQAAGLALLTVAMPRRGYRNRATTSR